MLIIIVINELKVFYNLKSMQHAKAKHRSLTQCALLTKYSCIFFTAFKMIEFTLPL